MRGLIWAMAMATVPAAAAAQLPPVGAILPEGALLDVQAEGKVRREPDQAQLNAGVVAQAATAAAAMQAQATRMQGVLAALDAASALTAGRQARLPSLIHTSVALNAEALVRDDDLATAEEVAGAVRVMLMWAPGVCMCLRCGSCAG